VSDAPSPTPTPTPTVLTVGGGEQPPQIFGGDCAAMLTDAEASEFAGASVVLSDVASSDEGYTPLLGAGGVACMWEAGNHDILRVAVFPESGLDGVDLQADREFQGEGCSWYCTAVTSQDGFAVVTTLNVSPVSYSAVATLAEQVTPLVAGRALAAYEEWSPDRSGWIDMGCEELGAKVGAQLGVGLTGKSWGIYIDPPLVPGQIADEASGFTVCALVDESGQFAEAWWYGGAAWGGEAGTEGNGLPSPWTGRATEAETRNDMVAGPGWVMSDGVNLVRMSPVPPEFPADIETLAAAVAAALGS
jgi:hypothetical protein